MKSVTEVGYKLDAIDKKNNLYAHGQCQNIFGSNF